jgi:hypothetical protein
MKIIFTITGSTDLLKLHEKFQALMFDIGIPLISFAEGLKTILPLNLKVMMVPTESSGQFCQLFNNKVSIAEKLFT